VRHVAVNRAAGIGPDPVGAIRGDAIDIEHAVRARADVTVPLLNARLDGVNPLTCTLTSDPGPVASKVPVVTSRVVPPAL
jgi:hypothetical protein